MKCPKCGKEFSEHVLELHIQRCKGNKKAEPKKEKTPKK